MTRRPQKRHPKILHGLDMDAIIEVSDDENNDGGNDQTTPPATIRPSRTTRQRVNGEAPALYSAKYHPMDDVMRPAAAKRYHGEAFERDEDTDDPEECMTDVGSIDEEDQDDAQPVPRKWSTGIRHSGRLDAPSHKPVNYNMKRHPQDAQLSMLEKSSSPNKRSRTASYKYTVHPELLEGDDESSEEEEADDDEPPSVGEAPIPTKRVAYSVQHSSGRRSVQVVIDDSDDESSIDSDEDADKENTPPTFHMLNVETEAEYDNVNAPNRFAEDQMVGREITPPPANMMDVKTGADDDNANAANHFDEDQMVDREVTPPPASVVDAETDSEDDETLSQAHDVDPSNQIQIVEAENLPPAARITAAGVDTEDDETSSKADNVSPSTETRMVEKGNTPPATHSADAETDTEDDETASPSKADNVTASTQSSEHQMTDEVQIKLPSLKSVPDATFVQMDNNQTEAEAGLGSSALHSFLDAVAAEHDDIQMIDAAEEERLASKSLPDTTATRSVDRQTDNEAEARSLGPSLPTADLPSSPSSKLDDDILGALSDETDKVLASTQHRSIITVDGTSEDQAHAVQVALFRLPLPTPEEEAIFARLEGQLLPSIPSQVERPASSPNPFARTASTPNPFARAVATPNSSVRTASTPSTFISSTAQLHQSPVSGQGSASGEPVRGLFTPSHNPFAGAGSGSSFIFRAGAIPVTAPPGTGSDTNSVSTTGTEISSVANAPTPPWRLQTASALFPTSSLFINSRSDSLPGLVFGAPSNLYVSPTATDTPDTEDANDDTEEDDEEEEEEDEDDEGPAYPRYPLSELVRDRIRRSRQRSPSSRSSSIRSTNYPHGNPDLEPELPSIPEVTSVVSPFAPILNPLGVATTTEPDGQERRIPPGFDRHGSSARLFPAPSLPPRILNSSSFSAGQPLSSPIAEIPRGAIGISRPAGALPPRRIPGREPLFVLPDTPFSSIGRRLDGEDYESPDEGEHWDKENDWTAAGMETSEEE